MNKPYSVACDKNKGPILSVIKQLFLDDVSVLEVGSGTGQHGVFFAEKLPALTWHTSDLMENIPGIEARLAETALDNLRPPVVLDVNDMSGLTLHVDGVFTANTIHIMDYSSVEAFFTGVGKLLQNGGLFVLYGPINYNNQYTSESNRQFDQWLKGNDPHSGIRNFEDLQGLASEADLELVNDYPMPANNRILCWRKI